MVDLFPSGAADSLSIGKFIWDDIDGRGLELPPEKTLLLASFEAGDPAVAAYGEPVSCGEDLPDMPLFLRTETYVSAPLEATYQAAWKGFPQALKGLLEP